MGDHQKTKCFLTWSKRVLTFDDCVVYKKTRLLLRGERLVFDWQLWLEKDALIGMGLLTWHHADMDSVHVERITSTGDQVLKNTKYHISEKKISNSSVLSTRVYDLHCVVGVVWSLQIFCP